GKQNRTQCGESRKKQNGDRQPQHTHTEPSRTSPHGQKSNQDKNENYHNRLEKQPENLRQTKKQSSSPISSPRSVPMPARIRVRPHTIVLQKPVLEICRESKNAG